MKEEKNILDVISKILSGFCIYNEIAGVVPYGSGHINDTYHVKSADLNSPDFRGGN
ncbi:MAG: hypothetical protein M3O67_10335 [Bacteroidota bacterium]|nr:hypothetical protein [Bacteroidota bacterium]